MIPSVSGGTAQNAFAEGMSDHAAQCLRKGLHDIVGQDGERVRLRAIAVTVPAQVDCRHRVAIRGQHPLDQGLSRRSGCAEPVDQSHVDAARAGGRRVQSHAVILL